MNIHAITYKNIGPFIDASRTVRFSVGNHLVKAPIGSGKSFLFFDGPLFALYKRSKRPMLNRISENGSVVMIRSDLGKVFAIHREIKATKLGNDSVGSRLYVLPLNPDSVDEQLSEQIPHGLSEGTDILPWILSQGEEVIFSSQTELDQHLQSMLPPKEVMLNLHFLMQDHENIFDVGPAERITVFKHLFGLLGIDEGKERISEKKKEVQLTLKVKSDTQQFDMKLRRMLQEMRVRSGKLRSLTRPEASKEQYAGFEASLQTYDLDMIGEEIHIEKFSVDTVQLTRLHNIISELKYQRDAAFAGHEQIKHVQTERDKAGHEKELTIKKIQEIERESLVLQQKLTQQTLQSEETQMYAKKQAAQTAQQQLIEEQESVYLQQKGFNFESFLEYYQWLQGIVVRGKEIKGQQETIQERVLQAHQRKQENTHKREALSQQQQTLENEYEGQTKFHCELIKDMCPYVEVIKGVALVSLRQQKTFLQEQQEQLLKEAENIQNTLTQLESQQKENPELEEIKQHVQHLSWKTLDERYARYQAYEREQQQIDKELIRYAEQRRERDQLQELYNQKTSEISSLKKQAEVISQKYEQYEVQLQQLQQKSLASGDAVIYDTILENITVFLGAVDDIQVLVSEYTQIKYELKQLQETEKILGELSTIFSKEILLLVLQDFLPSLQEVMNVYLAQLVDYTVHFELQRSGNDKLELDLTVQDVHGKRPIRSLSGGQRTLLKLVRILSVASMMQTHFLFLDETINNLDTEAIAKVADLLENYMKSRQLKLYLVTHAPQIQEMQLWDSSILIS